MAYTKYYFSQASVDSNGTDVANWLTENASEYFDSVTYDSSDSYNPITCTIGDTACITFNPNLEASSDDYSMVMTLGNGLAKKQRVQILLI